MAQDSLEPLILDLLEWLGPHGRPYAEVLAAWRTSCPRLPVWEEANTRGYVDESREAGGDSVITISAEGRRFLGARRAVDFEVRTRP